MPGGWLKRLLGRKKDRTGTQAEKAPEGIRPAADPEKLTELMEVLRRHADQMDKDGIGTGVIAKKEGLSMSRICSDFLFSLLASLVRKDKGITDKQAEIFRIALGGNLPKEKLLEMIREKEDPTLPQLMDCMLPFVGTDMYNTKVGGEHYEMNSAAVTAAFGIFGNSLLAAGDGPDPEMEAKLAKSIRSMNDFYGTLIKEIGGK